MPSRSSTATGATAGTLQTVGWVFIALGVLTIVVGSMLPRGSRLARLLVSALMLLVTIVLSFLVLALLWSRAGSEYFDAGRARPRRSP